MQQMEILFGKQMQEDKLVILLLQLEELGLELLFLKIFKELQLQ
jgi:hypothetical protein